MWKWREGKGAVWEDDARRRVDVGVAVGKRAVGMVAVGKDAVWRGRSGERNNI